MVPQDISLLAASEREWEKVRLASFIQEAFTEYG